VHLTQGLLTVEVLTAGDKPHGTSGLVDHVRLS
jgi:hypothetical protein